ncbi:putative inorganic phosphate cotransporter [Cydia fagiglandana]|uniref:putative inorganic phosphate cotransporter n=1 Tax=Cydia fagiglandana TaxID=1458189 RepID=UPI002FEE3C7F
MDVEFLRYKYEDGAEGFIMKKKFKIGVRHLQALYMFAVSVVLGLLRGSSGVAMLAINDPTRLNDTYIEIHDWGRRTQSTTFSSFLFGYALMLLPAELCVSQFGSKMLVTAVLAMNGGFNVAMPNIVNKGGWIAVSNTQFLLGMSQACLAPANRIMLENWMPPNEKTFFSSIVYGGTFLGMILSLPCAGALSAHRLGWELIFYAQAMAALSSCAVWGILTAATPQQHQAIGDKEKEYIEEAKGFYKKKQQPVPWRDILRSPPFWGLAAAHAAFNAVFVFFLFDVPYFFTIFGRSLKDASVLAMLPFVVMWLVYLTTSPTIEWVYNSGFMSYVLSTTYYRKLINAIGAFSAIIGLTVLSNVNPDSGIAVVILTIALGVTGFQYSGFLDNYRNLSQNFNGTLVILSSAGASIIGAGVPLFTGSILSPDPTDFRRWRAVFLSLASFSVLGNVLYTVLGRGDRAEWDRERIKFGYHNDANQLELEELSLPKTSPKDDRPLQ